MNANITIHYITGICSLGKVLAAFTEKGLCQLTIDDTLETQIEHLQKNFPDAEIVDNSKLLKDSLDQIITFIEHPTVNLPVELDLHGTTFQKQVWEALMETKPGETMTYTQLAQKIGKLDAIRAVGTANGANKIAVLVPCHRIIRSDGGLGGYRWGLERKKTLLNREAEQNHNHRLTLL